MPGDAARFARDTIEAIADRQFQTESAPTEPILHETAWSVGRLSDEAIERLTTFLFDLTRRAPFTSPIWDAHRLVIEALEADLRNELVRRQAAEAAKGSSNGQH